MLPDLRERMVRGDLDVREALVVAQQHVVARLELLDHGVNRTDEILKKLFERHRFDYELRELNREDADEPMGRSFISLISTRSISTSKLSEEILSADRENIDSVEWDQKESKTYIYR